MLDCIFDPRLVPIFSGFKPSRSITTLFISVENLLLSRKYWLFWNLLLLNNLIFFILVYIRLSDEEDIPHKLVHNLLRLLQQILRVH